MIEQMEVNKIMKVVFLDTNGWYDTEIGNTVCKLCNPRCPHLNPEDAAKLAKEAKVKTIGAYALRSQFISFHRRKD